MHLKFESTSNEDLRAERKEIEVLRHKKFAVGDIWYLVDHRWFDQYCRYADSPILDKSANPGPIDNSSLLQTDKEIGELTLKHELAEGHDYVFLPQEAWQKLKARFGVQDSSHEIARSVIESGVVLKQLIVELRPSLLFVYLHTTSSVSEKAHKISVSRAATIDQLMTLLSNKCSMRINSENARLFFKHSDDNVELIKCSTSTSLEDAGFTHGQKILVDLKGPDGSWNVDETNPPTFMPKTTFSERDPVSRHSPLPIAGLHSSTSSNFVGRTPAGFMNMGPSSQTLVSSASTENFNKKMPPTGLCGLTNLGNTCFMNSALQCMSNTPPLCDYFVGGQYELEINEANPLGMRGEMARAFGDLMKQMWSPKNQVVNPRNFKSTVGRFAPQFSGYQQQDSQELLAFLLDGLHEDLNRVRKKPYIESKDYDGMRDSDAAVESWQNYKLRNNSIVVDLFHGLLKSTLVCPVCSKRSVTFDPFCYLSLPLMIKRERQINVLFVPFHPREDLIQCQVTVMKFGTVKDLADSLGRMLNKQPNRMVFGEIYTTNRISRFFSFTDELTDITERDAIIAYETPDIPQQEPVLRIVVYNRISRKSCSVFSSTLVGVPLLIVLRRDQFNYNVLRDTLRTACSRFVDWDDDDLVAAQQNDNENDSGVDENGDVNMDDASSSSTANVGGRPSTSAADSDASPDDDGAEAFRIILTNNFGASEVGSVPKLAGDQPLAVPSSGSDVYLCLEWKTAYEKFFEQPRLDARTRKHESLLTNRTLRKSIQLSECLDLFTTNERLGKHDLWYCPKCKSHQQATKKFDLWSVPEILIIHLKRFSYDSYYRNKIETLVDFPLEKLNVRPWIVNDDSQDALYDLIAVSNHYGGLGGGHYTAFAKNKYSQKWYLFDDSRVASVDDTEVVSKGAYVLVYARRRETSYKLNDPNFEMEEGESD